MSRHSHKIVAALTVAGLFTACTAKPAPPKDAAITPAPVTAVPIDLAPEDYARFVSAFYSGVMAYRVGENDQARERLGEATGIAPGEPAAWANLALANLRANDRAGTDAAIAKARELAPASSDVAMLAALIGSQRDRPDETIGLLRQAVELDGTNLRARFALADELNLGMATGRVGGDSGEGDDATVREEIRSQLDAVLAGDPGNLLAMVEMVRNGLKVGDVDTVKASLEKLAWEADGWPPDARAKLTALQAADLTDKRAAGQLLAQLINLLVATPAYQQSQAKLKSTGGVIADPIEAFLRLPSPSATPAEADLEIAFELQPTGGEGVPPAAPRYRSAGLDVDVNNDGTIDTLRIDQGLRIYLKTLPGLTEDATSGLDPAAAAMDYAALWSVDLDLEGDLDLVLARVSGPPVVLRNNGDATWTEIDSPFASVDDILDLMWADLDGDSDPDVAILDGAKAVRVFDNERTGRYTEASPAIDAAEAITIADADRDGRLDLVTLAADGLVTRHAWDGTPGGWTSAEIVQWEPAATDGSARLYWADFDNNGAVDLVASSATGARLWLTDADGSLAAWPGTLNHPILGVYDSNRDGRMDMHSLAGTLQNRGGPKAYHYQIVRLRALREGDQRNNSFGIGGDVMVRTGLVAQVQPVTVQSIPDPAIHFGLGTYTTSHIVRVRWPNGVAEVEFDLPADQEIIAEQRLKGSCPWLFADDGTGIKFVTDILWKSPLGLRLNAQTTAGVVQTTDWVNVRGDQLVERDGRYDLRITAELWETHYFDHVALMTVDHPAGTIAHVDERFAIPPPPLTVTLTSPLRPIPRAVDDAGTDVTDRIAARDGRTIDTFALGDYQGIAADHYVEIEFPSDVADDAVLVAFGWIYPTDSSINVAISQGAHETPRDLSIEVPDGNGRWMVARPHIGFPAGKNKTLLIDLAGLFPPGAADNGDGAPTSGPETVSTPRRLRLRTNMEVYWDHLAIADRRPDGLSGEDVVDTASASTSAPRIQTLLPTTADLRYRGFSYTNYTDGTGTRTDPEIPDYDRLSGPDAMWPDLVGFYTRFGDVRPLLSEVDDRYVILNAGDEIALTFDAPAPPPAGWVRDFVFVSDGWEKDGDLNTSYSKTVQPLPSHDRPEYAAPWTDGPVGALADDPVYKAHAQDWVDYHTRYVTAERFRRGVWPWR